MLGFSEVLTKQAINGGLRPESSTSDLQSESRCFHQAVLDVWFGNFEEDECFKEIVENFKKGKIWGFEDSMDPDVQRARAF